MKAAPILRVARRIASVVAAFGLGASIAFAQESARPEPLNPLHEEEIETDRDSFTPASTTVDPGRMIWESSYSFTDNRQGPEGHSFPEMVARVGVSDRLELRLGYNCELGDDSSSVSGIEFGDDDFSFEREERVFYGFKYQTSVQNEWVPQTAVLVESFTPTAGPTNFTTLMLSGVAGWKLPGDWQYEIATRYVAADDVGDRFNVWAPSTLIKAPIGEHWKVHAEYFALASDGREEAFVRHFISPGLHFIPTANVEIGVRIGFGLNDQSARFFSNAGFGIRF